MTKHRHRAKGDSRTLPFSGPVRNPENRAAHGNVRVVYSCRCGATIAYNVNGTHIEQGNWQEAS